MARARNRTSTRSAAKSAPANAEAQRSADEKTPRSAALPQALPAGRTIRPLRPALAHLSLLGVAAASAAALVPKLEAGLPFAAFERLRARTGVSQAALCALVGIPPGSLTRRRAARRLSPAESDRLVRAARILHQTLELFDGDAAAARAWLARPQRGLGGAAPLDFARSETGAREVEALLGRIEHGVVA